MHKKIKKGVSQLDWIMSLALFLLYLAWFFTFILPNFNFTKYKNTAIELLKDNFKDEFLYEKNTIPIFIRTNSTFINKPILINYTLTENYYITLSSFIVDNKLIFLSNLSNLNIFWLEEGEKNFTNYYPIQIEENRISTENISVYFEYSLPVNVRYLNEEKIKDISYKINNIPLIPVNYSYIKTSFAGIYKSTTQNINITNFVFAYNPEIYTFFDISNQQNYTFEMDFELDNYDYYYSNNLYYGTFNSTERASVSYTSDYVKIYTNNDALSIFFDDKAEFNFTYYNTTLLLNIKTTTKSYKIVFHTTDINKQDYTYAYGLLQKKSGYLINETNYTFLKNKWNIPAFYINIYNDTPQSPIYEIGTNKINARNIYSETEQILIWQDEELIPVFVNYRIW